VAVIGWITGLFGASVGGTEQLQIMPDSYINASSNVLHLHVVNKGSDVTIYKIEIVGLYTAYEGDTNSYYFLPNTTGDVADTKTKSGDAVNTQWKSDNPLVISAGSDVWVLVNKTDAASTATSGTMYTVKVYTKTGNVFTATVQAVSK
jgi:hypothetical protein